MKGFTLLLLAREDIGMGKPGITQALCEAEFRVAFRLAAYSQFAGRPLQILIQLMQSSCHHSVYSLAVFRGDFFHHSSWLMVSRKDDAFLPVCFVDCVARSEAAAYPHYANIIFG